MRHSVPRSRDVYCGAMRVVVTLRADFYDRPLLYPGFSELMRDVFTEEHGVAARSAVGSRAIVA